MDYSEFVAIATAPKQPDMKHFEQMAVFAHGADKELLWSAMGNSAIHPIYRNLIATALQYRLIEELEREQARKRKLEEEARLAASRDEQEQDAMSIETQRRRLR